MSKRSYRVILAALGLVACGGSGAAPAPATTPTVAPGPGARGTLYLRLGGQPAIAAVVGEFVARLASDPRIKFRFANSDVPGLTGDLVDFVCVATGGGCAYHGREMKILHASMHVSEDEWTAVVEALVGALDKFKVPAAEKGEILGAIGGTKGDIVDPPGERPTGAELAAIDAAAKDVAAFGVDPELLGAALTALRVGQRSYAEQLYSMAEVTAAGPALGKLAPLFRADGPPRITTPLEQMPKDAAPQPTGAVGGSDDDAGDARPEQASLAGTLRLTGKADAGAFGVVMLTPTSGKVRRRTAKQRVIEQRGREFAPHLMAVPVGSTIAFPNFDDIYHNVFSRSDVRSFDLGIFKNGQARSLTFDRPGIVRVGCNLHANMSTSIIVVAAPHYAVTDAEGKFRFKSLKPGTYKLEAWTERSAAPVSQTIEVTAGDNALEVAAVSDAAPGTGQDKFGSPRGTSP